MTVYPRHPIPTWLWLTLIILLMTAWLSCCHGADVTFAVFRQPRIIEVPHWILEAIAAHETSSSYRPDGSIVYRNRADSAAGAVGVFQLKRCALREIGLIAHRSEIRNDPKFCEFAAILYLRHCYRLCGNWRDAIGMYGAGPTGSSDDQFEYYRAIAIASDHF